MNKSYNLLSKIEPTDKQLQSLMSNVLKDVKKRASLSSKKFQKLQLNEIEIALRKYNLLVKGNE